MVGEIKPERLRERLGDGESPVIVDIRNRADFDEGHLPGSRNVPLPEIPREIDEFADADHVVTVCPHGMASVKAGRIVEAYEDFEGSVDSLVGGLEGWDGPVESSDGAASTGEAGGTAPF
jgi:rhodanese-related sulfurtransferase